MRYVIILTILVWLMPRAVWSEIIHFRPDEPLFSGWGWSHLPDDSLDLDLNFDGILDINMKGQIQSGFDSFTYGNTLVLGRPPLPELPGTGVYQIPLRTGDLINANVSLDWWNATDVGWGTGSYGNLFNSYMAVGNQTLGIGFWRDDTTVGGSANGYLGVQFEIEGNTHYGWIYIRTGTNHGWIDEWAYESTSETGIVAGAIPEPSSMALLLAGAFGIWTVRKRKQEASVRYFNRRH